MLRSVAWGGEIVIIGISASKIWGHVESAGDYCYSLFGWTYVAAAKYLIVIILLICGHLERVESPVLKRNSWAKCQVVYVSICDLRLNTVIKVLSLWSSNYSLKILSQLATDMVA